MTKLQQGIRVPVLTMLVIFMYVLPIYAQSCDCSGDVYNCDSFDSKSSAQNCFAYCLDQGQGDVHRLDSDNDGDICESIDSFNGNISFTQPTPESPSAPNDPNITQPETQTEPTTPQPEPETMPQSGIVLNDENRTTFIPALMLLVGLFCCGIMSLNKKRG